MRPCGKSSRKCLQAGVGPIPYDESGRAALKETRCNPHGRSRSEELSRLIIRVMNEAERSFVLSLKSLPLYYPVKQDEECSFMFFLSVVQLFHRRQNSSSGNLHQEQETG